MEELIEKAVREKMCEDVDGTKYYILKHRNGQALAELEKRTKELIAENGLSVSEAKGFLEYMKLIIDSCSYLPQTK